MAVKKYAVLVFCFTLTMLTACENNHDNINDSTDTTTSISDITTVSSVVTEDSKKEEITESQIHGGEIAKFSSRYGYYQLTSDEKEVYNQIKDAVMLFQKTVDLKIRLPRESVKKICEILVLEDNDLYYLTPTYNWTYNKVTDLVSQVMLSYQYNSMTVELINKKVEKKAEEIFADITDDMTDYDKVKYFHDVIIKSCETSENGDYVATPYGALVDGKALCEGYSRAFAYLCNKAEIENIFATGKTSTGVDHMWNMVKLDNKWYNIDLTWDDQSNLPDALDFLDGSYISYDYFLFPAQQYNGNMQISQIYALPVTDETTYNYFVKNNLVADSYEEAVELLKQQLAEKYNAKENIVNIKVSDDKAFKRASESFSTSQVYNYVPEEYGPNPLYFLNNQDTNTIQIIYKY